MEGSARGLILALCQHLLGETEDNDEKIIQLECGLGIGTFRISLRHQCQCKSKGHPRRDHEVPEVE